MTNIALNILFIDDSEDDVELTVAELSRADYQVDATRLETEPSIREALQQQQWDAIICDFKMPQMTADKALQIYKEHLLDIPFIIISGVVEAEDVVFLLKQGAHDFLNKNALARLIPALERELRESQGRTQKRLAEQKVRTLSLAVEQSPVSVVITNSNGQIEYVNPKFESTTGYTVNEAIGRQFGFTAIRENADDREAKQKDTQELQKLWALIKEQGGWQGELCSLPKQGPVYWEYVNVSPLADDTGNITSYVSIHEDVTVRRLYEEKLRKQALTDELTGLANRSLMIQNLNDAVAQSRQDNSVVALFCIDVDHFKKINDTCGHMVGDELLIHVADRLSSCIKKTDTLARMGGDEFVFIIPQVKNDQMLVNIANRVTAVFARPFEIFTQEHYVSVSMGIAKFPDNSTDPQELLRDADLAMYQAKSTGRNCYKFFDTDLDFKFQERVALETALHGVETRDELELHYQPIVDGNTSQIVRCEALLRWRNSEGGYIMPDDFIPVAEDTGLITALGNWVIERTCKDLQYLHQAIDPELKIAINISPHQLKAADFVDFLVAQLQHHGISPTMLELEMTERVIIDDQGETGKNLKRLHGSGIKLSIDDFGTGYSSLSYLQKYPFSTLKIDRSFINGVETNAGNAKLTKTIITMAHSLGMQVVAEGVETDKQRAFLSQNQCDYLQGYFWSKPVKLDGLIVQLEEDRNGWKYVQ